MLKRGLITIACSLAAIIVSFAFGVGPCEVPSTIPGAILFLAGGLGLLFGCWTTTVGLIEKLVRRVRRG